MGLLHPDPLRLLLVLPIPPDPQPKPAPATGAPRVRVPALALHVLDAERLLHNLPGHRLRLGEHEPARRLLLLMRVLAYVYWL